MVYKVFALLGSTEEGTAEAAEQTMAEFYCYTALASFFCLVEAKGYH